MRDMDSFFDIATFGEGYNKVISEETRQIHATLGGSDVMIDLFCRQKVLLPIASLEKASVGRIGGGGVHGGEERESFLNVPSLAEGTEEVFIIAISGAKDFFIRSSRA